MQGKPFDNKQNYRFVFLQKQSEYNTASKVTHVCCTALFPGIQFSNAYSILIHTEI